MCAYDASHHTLRMQVGREEQLSEILHCWFSGTQKNNTWLVESLQYVLSTFELFVVRFLLSIEVEELSEHCPVYKELTLKKKH